MKTTALAVLVSFAAYASPQHFIVHEWGTFTSVVGEDGKPLTWRPLQGPSDLPAFVHTFESYDQGLRHSESFTGGLAGDESADPRCTGKCMRAPIRMETPVLYFYAAEPMTVEARVDFPNGLITEWYPMARQFFWAGIDWGKVRIVPHASAQGPTDGKPSHYYPARAVDAATVEVCAPDGRIERDRFLFYRGVGNFTLPMTVKLGARAEVTRRDDLVIDGPRGATLVFERQGDRLGFTSVPGSDGKVTVSRPELTATVDGARDALLRALIGTGLYEKEAQAMLATWNDSWFEPGLRVFSLMPTPAVARVLPLTLSPSPSELVRVLVARIEVLTPERQVAFTRDVQIARDNTLAREGRFAEPLLQLAVAKAHGAERAKLEKLLVKAEPRAGYTGAQ